LFNTAVFVVSLSSRQLVLEVFRGKTTRIPTYFWLGDPMQEAKVGDIVGVRCWFEAFANFLYDGGPFKRTESSYHTWSEQLNVEDYDWPDLNSVRQEVGQKIKETVIINKGRSFQAEILGPTEYSEYSCSPGQTEAGRRLDQVYHRFDFAVLTKLNPSKARQIHSRFLRLALAAAEEAAEHEAIDSVRIADDFCYYRGSIYDPQFTQIIIERQAELAGAVKKREKYALLHADGNIIPYLDRLGRAFDGLHPLDICPKSTLQTAFAWASRLREVRERLPETVFFTGIPIDLLCNKQVRADDLIEVITHVISNVGRRRLVLTTTHRPYPGSVFEDFKEKVWAINDYMKNM